MRGSVYELALFIIRNDHGAAGQPHSAIPPGFDGHHSGPFFRAVVGGQGPKNGGQIDCCAFAS